MIASKGHPVAGEKVEHKFDQKEINKKDVKILPSPNM